MIDPVILIVLGIVVIGVVFALERTIARTEVGVSLALAIVAIDVLGVPMEVVVSGFQVSAEDLVFALLAVAGIARLLRGGSVDPLQAILLAFLGLVFASLATGVLEFGVGTAVNESRTYLRFVGAALYLSTVDGSDAVMDRVMLPWFAFAAFLLGLTVLRWFGLVAGLTGQWFMDGADDLRVIDSFRTLVLLQVLLVIWGARPPVPRIVTAAAPILLAAVVLLQHRTLWIALTVGALVWGARSRRIARRIVPAALAATFVGGLLVFTVFGDPTSIRDELETSATNADTFVWRMEGWRQLIFETGPDDAVEIAVGLPFGSGFDRRIEGQLIDVTPHNFFIETYLRTGVLGVALASLLFAIPLVRLRRTRGWGRYLQADALLVILVTQLLFLQTSHPSAEQAMLIGIAMATAARVPRDQVRGVEETPGEAPSLRDHARAGSLVGARP